MGSERPRPRFALPCPLCHCSLVAYTPTPSSRQRIRCPRCGGCFKTHYVAWEEPRDVAMSARSLGPLVALRAGLRPRGVPWVSHELPSRERMLALGVVMTACLAYWWFGQDNQRLVPAARSFFAGLAGVAGATAAVVLFEQVALHRRFHWRWLSLARQPIDAVLYRLEVHMWSILTVLIAGLVLLFSLNLLMLLPLLIVLDVFLLGGLATAGAGALAAAAFKGLFGFLAVRNVAEGLEQGDAGQVARGVFAGAVAFFLPTMGLEDGGGEVLGASMGGEVVAEQVPWMPELVADGYGPLDETYGQVSASDGDLRVDHYVEGYTREDGSTVRGHWKGRPG